jgi:hypothetical protein
MAHYRKINTSIWNEKIFNQLSTDAQCVFLFISTHPHLTSLGGMRGSIEGLASERGWVFERFERAFEENCEVGLIARDQTAPLIWLPHFLKYNAPATPNVVKSWPSVLHELPECFLRDLVIQHTKRFVQGLSRSFRASLDDCFKPTGE